MKGTQSKTFSTFFEFIKGVFRFYSGISGKAITSNLNYQLIYSMGESMWRANDLAVVNVLVVIELLEK